MGLLFKYNLTLPIGSGKRVIIVYVSTHEEAL